jgi:hypothetical protein
MAKLHWTQTPEGRARMSRLARRAHHKGGKRGKQHSGSEEAVIAYAFGHVEAWLDIYANSVGLSVPAVTYRVAELLRATARRKVVGAGHQVSPLRSHTAA